MNAIITGATKGIGLAITRELLTRGYNVCINARSESDLKELKAELEIAYPSQQVYIKPTDVQRKEEVQSFADFALSVFNNDIDVLVNNAGVFLPGEVHSEAEGILETQIETNLYSAYYLSRAIVPCMKEQKHGYVFNMCSIASKIAYPNGGSYGISKFALLGFSKALREEMKEFDVKVISIMPGATWSNSWKGIDLPKDRLMQASDIAKIVGMTLELSDSAVMEEIILRPQLGDL